MGYSIYKPDAFDDFYVMWCSISDSPVQWGTDEETLAFALKIDREKEQYARPRWEAAFDRARSTGSSSMISNDGWFGDDAYFIFEQRGLLQFSDLRAFCDSFDPATQRFDLSFLTPFEDCEEVRHYEDGDS
jgi:hypothetical protein